jgi:hypothetical protein
VRAVELVLLRADSVVGRGISDDSGRFVLKAAKAGDYKLRALHIGYATAELGSVRLDDGTMKEAEIRMSISAVRLNAIIVASPRQIAALDRSGFYGRRRMGFGKFIDPEMIAERNATDLTQLFQGVAGVRLIPLRFGKYAVAVRSNCFPRVFVDNVPDPDFDWGSLHPFDVAAIEIYRSPAEIPVQYSGALSSCGVVLLWLKS